MTMDSTGAAISTFDVPARSAPAEEPLEHLEARICSMAAKIASSTCEWLQMLAEFDRRLGWAQWGVKSTVHWLSWACSVSAQAAREYVRVARALEKLPQITAAFAVGALSFSKVKAVTRVADAVPEQVLLDQAMVHTASQLERVVRAFRKTESSGRSQQDRRKMRWFFDDDGMLVFTGRLPADEGALLVAALQQAEHSLGAPPGADEPACPADDGPSLTKDSYQFGWDGADALMAMAMNALAAGGQDSSGDDRTLVVLHLDAEVLAEPEDGSPSSGEATRRCHLQDGPGVSRAAALRLSCDAAVVAVVRSSLGRYGHGRSLRLGRKSRQISPALRRALRHRDDGCQHPGCHRRRHLEAHHVVHWANGGRTDLDNLVLVCRFHHMQVHEAGWVVRAVGPVGGESGWSFSRPDGVAMPAVRDLAPGWPDPEPSPEWDPELIRPGWRGERFSLADSVGAFCSAADHHTQTPTADQSFSEYDDDGSESFLAREDAAFYAGIRINDFSQHLIDPTDWPLSMRPSHLMSERPS